MTTTLIFKTFFILMLLIPFSSQATAIIHHHHHHHHHQNKKKELKPLKISKKRGVKDKIMHQYHHWEGTRYLYGGITEHGVDCSSFVQHVYGSAFSFRLPRTVMMQIAKGIPINRYKLKTGDLVFFITGPRFHHVGIYIGAGKFIHASKKKGVTISRLDNVYWSHHYLSARRILQPFRSER